MNKQTETKARDNRKQPEQQKKASLEKKRNDKQKNKKNMHTRRTKKDYIAENSLTPFPVFLMV